MSATSVAITMDETLLHDWTREAGEQMLARRATEQDIQNVKLELKSGRPPTLEELWAMEEKFPAVCGPSPSSYAARHGLKLSKSYLEHLRRQRANGNGTHKVVPRRRKLTA